MIAPRARPTSRFADVMPTSLTASRCLVVGGAGNLGGHMVRMLLERGAAHVACFDVVKYAGDKAESIVSHVGDVTSFDEVRRAVEGIDVVFHTASIVDIRPVDCGPSVSKT